MADANVFKILGLTPEDARMMLIANCHTCHSNCNHQMKQYVHGRKQDGTNVVRLDKTWDKIVLAARTICAVKNPQDIAVVGTQDVCKRAVLKFARYIGAFAFAGRFTPGSFTNQIQRAFREPRLLIVHNTASDHQAITEASYVNIPVIAFCNTNSNLTNVDIAIPCNNENKHSAGLMFYLLAREVLRMRGKLSRDSDWDVMPDMFFVRDVDQQAEEENAAGGNALTAGPDGVDMGDADQYRAQAGGVSMSTAPVYQEDDWGNEPSPAGAAGMGAAPMGVYGAVGESVAAPMGAVMPPQGAVMPPVPAQATMDGNWATAGDDWGDSTW